MARLEINGRIVEVDDSFLQLSPEQQNANVDEIAKSLGAAPSVAQPAPAQTASSGPPPAAPQWQPQWQPQMAPPISTPTGHINWQDQTKEMQTSAPPSVQGASNQIRMGVQDVGRGLARAAGTPVDLMTGALNLGVSGVNAATGAGWKPIQKPFMGSEMIADTAGKVAGAFGVPMIKWEDRSPEQKAWGNVADYGTQAMTMGAGLAARAPAMAAEAAQGALPADTALGRIFESLSRPYTQNAARTFAGDAASGAGAGAGVTAAQGMAPDNPWAEMLGALAGGVSGSALKETIAGASRGIGSWISGKMPDLNVPVDPVTGAPVPKSVSRTAGRIMQEGADRPVPAANTIGDNAAMMRSEGLPVPTAGLVSEDLGLMGMESAARVKNKGPFIANDNRLRDAATGKVESIRDPGADQGSVNTRAGAFRGEQLQPLDRNVQSAEQMAQQAQQARATEAAPFVAIEPQQARATASTNLDRAVVDETYAPARTEKNRLYEQTPPDQPVDTTGMARAAGQTQERIGQMPEAFRPAQTPPGLGDLADTTTMPYGAASGTRMALREAEGRARSTGEFQRADNVRDVRRPLQEAIDAANPEAAANYRENFAPRFRAGNGDAMSDFTRAIDRDPNRTATPRSATADRFLQTPEDAASLNRALADAPTQQAAESAVRDYMRAGFASVARNGVVDPAAARAWVGKNSAVLDQFPAIRTEFDNLVASSGQNAERATQAGQFAQETRVARDTAARDIERGPAGALINGKAPRELADSVLNSGYGAERKMAEINRVVAGDAQAQRGWRAAVADVVADRAIVATRTGADTGVPGVDMKASLGNLEKVFTEHEKLLVGTFTPEQMSSLRQAHKLLEPLKNALLQATPGSQTAANFWNTVFPKMGEAGLKLYQGQLKGGGTMRSLRLLAEMLPNDTAAAARLVNRAWFDPELAQHLLKLDLPDISGPAANARLRALNAAATGGAESSASEKPKGN